MQNPAAGAVSPVGNDDAVDPPAGEDPPARARRATRRASRPSSGDDWRYSGAKKKTKRGTRPRGTPTAVAKAGSAAGEDSKETPEEKQKRLDREATLRAVDAALQGASASMKRCYDQGKAKAGDATLSFRVRRTGYVISPSVSGVEPAVQRCIRGVLGRLRVSSVRTPTAVTRTLRFRRY